MFARQPASSRVFASISALTLSGALLAVVATSPAAAAAARPGKNQPAPTVSSVAASESTTTQFVANSGFESNLSGWNSPTGKLTRVTAGAHSGSAAAQLGTAVRQSVVLNDTPNAVASTTKDHVYVSSAWVRATVAPLTVQIRQREVSGGVALLNSPSKVVLQDTAWHLLSVSHKAVATGSMLDLNVIASDLRVGVSLLVDDVRVNGGAPAPVPAPAPSPTPEPAPACTVSEILVPSCGALWGAYTKPGAVSGATDWTTAYTAMESVVQRKFDIVKRYHDWSGTGGNGAFPDAHEQRLAADGRVLHLAWTAKNWSTGTSATWSDIAAGKYDASIVDPAAQRIKTFGKKVFLDFDHEMDGVTRTASGTMADYAAAHRHIHDRFAAAGVTNVIWVWTPTGYMGNITKIAAAYPGDAYVDWIGYDPYNFFGCNGSAWKSFSTTVDGFYTWLLANGHADKPFMLAEYGSAPNSADPLARAAWFQGQVDGMKSHPNIKAVQLWNSDTSACPTMAISADQAALTAWGAAGRDPYFRSMP